MSSYPNVALNNLNNNVVSGSGIDLARIPANFDADQKSLKVIFATKSSLAQKEEGPLLDENNKVIDGVDLTYTFGGQVHTARCSLNGLVVLSNDNRVKSITLSGSGPIV